jgi:hypothetical protein
LQAEAGKCKMQFVDGEKVVGYAIGYSPERIGFFLIG